MTLENDDNFLNKELEDLNKVIQSANELVSQMGGNPLGALQQQYFDVVKNQNSNASPNSIQIHQPAPTILHYVNKSNNPGPRFEKDGDSGFDLRANLEQPMVLKPMSMIMVPTGLYFEVVNGYEVQIRSRSGLALRNQVFVLNQPGTVDSGYRNEILVMLFNLGPNELQINHGDRIAQGVVCPVIGSGKLTIMRTDKLSPSERGMDGFGSTGNK